MGVKNCYHNTLELYSAEYFLGSNLRTIGNLVFAYLQEQMPKLGLTMDLEQD